MPTPTFTGLQDDADRSSFLLMGGQEQRTIIAYKRTLKEINGHLATAFRKYADADGELSLADMAKYGRMAELEKSIVAEARKLGAKQVRQTDSALTDIYTDQYLRTQHTLEFGAGKSMFGAADPVTIAQAVNNPLDLIGWQDRSKFAINTMTRQIRDEIGAGIIQGHGYTKIARAIKNRMDIGAGKALRIVRTEAHRVQVLGRLEMLDKAQGYAVMDGETVNRVWRSTLDNRTRPSHQAMDGQFADKDNLFTIEGIKTIGPGNSGVARIDVNCRCGVVLQWDGETPRERSAKDPATGKSKIIPYQNYKDWAKDKDIKPPKTPKRRPRKTRKKKAA